MCAVRIRALAVSSLLVSFFAFVGPLEAQGRLVQITRVDPFAQTVELHNFGTSSQDLSGWFFCQRPNYRSVGGSIGPGETRSIALPLTLSPTGDELAIYQSFSFTSSTEIMDYLDWGSGRSLSRRSVAEAAVLWSGAAIAGVPASHAIEL